MKILFVGAMHKEIKDLIKKYNCTLASKLVDTYPLYKGTHEDKIIYVLECFVGDTNAAVATTLALNEVKPDYVFKVGCVGGNSPDIHKDDVIVPLGFFHSGSWITRSNKDNEPTKDASLWQSVFGEKPYQVNAENLGNIPYHFYPDAKLTESFKNIVKELKKSHHQSYIGGGNMWFFDKEYMQNIAENILPTEPKDKHWVADMESFAIAHACHVFKIPFFGFYVVSNSDFYESEDYEPDKIAKQIDNALAEPIEQLLSAL